MTCNPVVDTSEPGGRLDAVLNVAAWQEHSRINGPGDRFVLWLQGCERACPGCFNPGMHSRAPRHTLAVEPLANWLLSQTRLEGITYTGGEPMLQAAALAVLSKRLRAGGLSIVCYTGYILEDMQRGENPAVTQLLEGVDILIDGPFEQSSAAPGLWRGSANQRVHFLTPRYAAWAPRINQRQAQMEISVGRRQWIGTGVWPAGLADEIQHALRQMTLPAAPCLPS